MSKIYEALELAERTQKLKAQEPSHVPERFLPDQPAHLQSNEELVSLYYTIRSLVSAKKGRIIEFVGTQQGEGTSTLAEEFGRVSAMELGKTVLLFRVDDWISEREYTSHGGNAAPNLERLMQRETSIQEAFSKNGHACFFICPVTSEYRSAFSVLTSPDLEGIFEDLKEHFDLILIDMPPLAESPHALTICKSVDGVVLVVEAERTRWKEAERSKKRILQAGGNILGAIMNKRRNYIPAPFD